MKLELDMDELYYIYELVELDALIKGFAFDQKELLKKLKDLTEGKQNESNHL